jgi:hypothetical protein
MRKSVTIALSATIAAAALTVSAPSHAGYGPMTAPSGCSRSPNGSGICWGSLSGFHASPGGLDQAYFSHDVGYVSFYAYAGGVSGACSKYNPEPLWVETENLAAGDWFQIEWNPQGQCSSLQVMRASYYQ